MKPPVPGLTLFLCISLRIAAAGCIGGHYFPKMDILVSKYDSGGQDIWSTTIDSGKEP